MKENINDCYNKECSYWRKTKMCRRYLKAEDCNKRIATLSQK